MSKAQISVFIVIAVILVFIGVSFFAFTSNINWFQDETPSFRVAEFVESCMEQQTRDGVNKLGRQGGWIYSPDVLYAGRNEDEIASRARGFEDIGNVKLPYWYYFDNTDEDFRMNLIPPYDSEEETSMRMQLKKYLDETLEQRCLQDFAVFDDAYEINNLVDELEHNVEFRNDEIVVTLEYPLEINEIHSESSETTSSYMITYDNKLEVPYHLAKDMAYAMDGSSFLDYRTMQMLTPYMSKNSRDLLPPNYDIDLNFDMQPWLVRDIKDNMKKIFASNMHTIQLREAYTHSSQLPAELSDSPLAQGISQINKKYFLGNPNEGEDYSQVRDSNPNLFREYENIDVRGEFDTYYPLDVSITPSLGNSVVLPDAEFFAGLVPMGLTTYQAAYEFTGPVVFSFQDVRQSSNDEFEFRVAYEVNVENNVPLKERYPDISVDVPDSLEVESQSLVCDRSQFVSNLVSINITDSIAQRESLSDPKMGVEDAFVEFRCGGGIATCFVGQTSFDEDKRTDLSFRLPVNCDPGTLEISKFGHKDIVIENVNPSTSSPINLGEHDMPSSKEVSVNINLVRQGDVADSIFRGAIHDIDTGVVILEHKEDEDFIQVAKFDEDTVDSLTMSLLPGEYSIEAFIIREREDHIIPSKTETVSSIPRRTVTIPEILLEAWISGIYEKDSFTVSKEDLITSYNLELTIPIIDIGLPSTHEELEEKSDELDRAKIISQEFDPSIREIR